MTRLGDKLLARLEAGMDEELYLRAARRAVKARAALCGWTERRDRYRRALRVLARAAANLASRL